MDLLLQRFVENSWYDSTHFLHILINIEKFKFKNIHNFEIISQINFYCITWDILIHLKWCFLHKLQYSEPISFIFQNHFFYFFFQNQIDVKLNLGLFTEKRRIDKINSLCLHTLSNTKKIHKLYQTQLLIATCIHVNRLAWVFGRYLKA